MQDERNQKMSVKEQIDLCWKEYFDAEKSPEEIQKEIDEAWRQHDNDLGSCNEANEAEEFYDDDADEDNDDSNYFKQSKAATRRKSTVRSHNAIKRTAEIAEKNFVKRQEDDVKCHRPMAKIKKDLKHNSEKIFVSRGAKKCHSRSGRAATLINIASLNG